MDIRYLISVRITELIWMKLVTDLKRTLGDIVITKSIEKT